MKYFNSVLFKSSCALALIFMTQSCENEFSEIGTDIVGTPGFEIKNKTYPVTTYNKKITPFQSNGLAENLLGYYYDPIFGASTVNFVGQLTPTSLTPVFGENTILDSVVLTIPYNSTATSEETSPYKLDSLYGGTESDAIKLSIFRKAYWNQSGNQAKFSYRIPNNSKYINNQNYNKLSEIIVDNFTKNLEIWVF